MDLLSKLRAKVKCYPSRNQQSPDFSVEWEEAHRLAEWGQKKKRSDVWLHQFRSTQNAVPFEAVKQKHCTGTKSLCV